MSIAKMVYPEGTCIDFGNWNLELGKVVTDIMNKAVIKELNNGLEIDLGHGESRTTLKVEIHVPIGHTEEDNPFFSVDFETFIMDSLETTYDMDPVYGGELKSRLVTVLQSCLSKVQDYN